MKIRFGEYRPEAANTLGSYNDANDYIKLIKHIRL